MDLEKYIRKAAQLDDKSKETLTLDVSGEEFEFHKLDESRYSEILSDLVDIEGDISKADGLLEELIYYCLPDLHDPELLEAFDAVHPPDIVHDIFSSAEITKIGVELLDFNDFTSQDIVKKV